MLFDSVVNIMYKLYLQSLSCCETSLPGLLLFTASDWNGVHCIGRCALHCTVVICSICYVITILHHCFRFMHLDPLVAVWYYSTELAHEEEEGSDFIRAEDIFDVRRAVIRQLEPSWWIMAPNNNDIMCIYSDFIWYWYVPTGSILFSL